MKRLCQLIFISSLSTNLIAQNNPITFDPAGGAGGDIFGIKVTETGNNTTKLHVYRNFTFEAEDLDRLVIDAGGQVGIGTTNPDSKLSVMGRGRFGYGPIFIDWTHETNWADHPGKWAGYIGFNAYRNNDDPKDHYWGSNNYTDKGVIEGSSHGFRFLFRNHSSHDSNSQHPLNELMRLTDSGNLALGTTTTGSHKLAVEGSIGAREIKVEANGWSDFVFENNYDLRTLEEVEEHINANGHLPEIPSETEVIKNGINLGEMNAKLLQKIEELTLYLIEQNKEIKELKEKVNRLENE